MKPIRSQNGSLALILSLVASAGLFLGLSAFQKTARQVQQAQARHADSTEGFYASELAARHMLLLDTLAENAAGAADSRGRHPALLNPLASQWASYAAANPTTTTASAYDPEAYEKGIPLNYARTRQLASLDAPIKRYENGRLRVKPKGADGRICGEISFRSDEGFHKLCALERPESIEFVTFTNKQKELWWYLDNNGIPLGNVNGKNRIVAGVGSGAWGYWGFIAAVPDVDIVEDNTWVARNDCRDDEIGIGSAGDHTFRLRCAKLKTGFSHAKKSNHYVQWKVNLSSPCPKNKAMIAHLYGPQNYRIGYRCAKIKKP